MKKTLKTGDFILFNTHSDNFLFKIFDMAIRWWTATPFTHCGFVIVNPPWAPVDTYVWDSSLHDFPDPSDKKIKFGVALVPFEHYHKTKSDLYVRKPQDNKTCAVQEFRKSTRPQDHKTETHQYRKTTSKDRKTTRPQDNKTCAVEEFYNTTMPQDQMTRGPQDSKTTRPQNRKTTRP